MVQLSDEVSKLIERRVAEGGYASADELLRDVLTAEGAEATPGDFAPGELASLIEEGERSGRDEGWLTEEDFEAQFAAFRQEWLAQRGRQASR